MAQKVPEIVLKLQRLAKPTYVNERWRKPVLSARKLASIRKAMVVSGVYWPPKPLRDRSRDMELKLSKHERMREERQKTIEENMKNMPRMVEEYRAKMREKRRVAREKEKTSEEKKYLIATGKVKEFDGQPPWQVHAEGRKTTKNTTKTKSKTA